MPSRRHCPSCSQPLREFVATHEKQSLRLDLCRPCQLMWFDRGELEVFPKAKTVRPSEIDEQIALAQIQAASPIGEPLNPLPAYVEIGIDVLTLLLRLFL